MSPNPSTFAEYLNHSLDLSFSRAQRASHPCRPFLRGELLPLDIRRHKTAQMFCRRIGDRTTVCDSLNRMGGCLWCACAVCGGFGFARNTATTFDVFYWLQIANFDGLLNSAPNGPD